MKKRSRPDIDQAVVNVWTRELGQLSTRNFAHRFADSEDLVWRLEIHKKLEKHDGCVNTLSFNAGGDILVSGSDDLRVILWDWETGRDKLSFRSDSASSNSGRGRSEDYLYCVNDLKGYPPYVPLNAIAIDPRNPNLFAVGGMDEFARLYDIRKYKWDGSSDFGQPAHYFCPQHLIGNEDTGITGLSFSDQSELLVSYGDEFIYLLTQSMGLRNPPFPSSSSTVSMGSDTSKLESGSIEASSSSMDLDGRNAPQVYTGHRNCETVKCVSFLGQDVSMFLAGLTVVGYLFGRKGVES
ncbi:hypothetical protein DKX38_006450 [Salix brachista]|uniref:Uncharacterized protein n=1 Tax=Salix brachista TaxID=2182728 RepID=A0A5N5N4D1_9ROSI|nr:hypothetical protein DKX38_006450 [Salix brachista]